MAAIEKRPPARMTLAEFLVWEPGGHNTHWWQLVDGEPVAMAPPSEAHAAIQGELGRLLGNHLLAAGDRCRVLTGPGVVPKLASKANFRIPDLGVTCAPPSGKVMMAEPVLLIEILSPNNEAETRANVWAFATIPSVREILLVHSTRIGAELLRREDDGTWPDVPVMVGAADELRLASVDFAVALTSVYRTSGVVDAA